MIDILVKRNILLDLGLRKMNIIYAILLGILEGLTEFLPISSTYHLFLASRFFNLPFNEFVKLFNIFIQSGAILSVVWLYRRELLSRVDLAFKTLIAFFPSAFLGALFYRLIKNIFLDQIWLQTFLYLLIGGLFIFFEILVKRGSLKLEKAISSLTIVEAFLIGSGQALAFFPGVSRAGIVILIMMLLGYRRDEAALFSFFLAIPTIIGASLFDLLKTRHSLVSFTGEVLPLSVGLFVSFLVAMAAVRWFIGYLQKHSLNLFAFYRFFLGSLTLLWLFLK